MYVCTCVKEEPLSLFHAITVKERSIFASLYTGNAQGEIARNSNESPPPKKPRSQTKQRETNGTRESEREGKKEQIGNRRGVISRERQTDRQTYPLLVSDREAEQG